MRWPFTRRPDPEPVAEAAPAAGPAQPAGLPARRGYEYGVPIGGTTEYDQGRGDLGTDRTAQLQELYEAYVACPWASASVNAIARTITAGGLVMDYDADDGQGDQEIPAKPADVQALEQMLAACNPREDIRQITRGVLVDLLVFADAFLEIVWLLGRPVALHSLDSPSMRIVADEHGAVSGYVQVTDLGQRAEFEPHEVIHISLDSPRSGLTGVSPTQMAQLPIVAWLFAAATLKETMRKGDPPSIHADLPAAMSESEARKWGAQYMVRNVGPKNIGQPITTKGGGSVTELQARKIEHYLAMCDQKRDEIVATYGVPPRKAGIMERGSLGGAGAEEGQDKTFRATCCDPLAELVLEKLNYALTLRGYGIKGWRLRFGDVDWRDSKLVEDIRDQRLRNGAITLNRYRVEIGEPPVGPEGDEPLLIASDKGLVLWRDLAAFSATKANPPPPPPAPFGQPPVDRGQPPEETERRRAVLAGAIREHRARVRQLARVAPEDA